MTERRPMGAPAGVFAYARFGLMNLMVIVTTGFILAGGVWMWGGFASVFATMTLIDELRGDDNSVPGMRHRWILDGLLYLNLPLLLAMCVCYAFFVGTGDPFGLAGLALGAGIDLDANRTATGPVGMLGGAASAGLCCGMAGINVAHELIHRVDRPFDRIVGRWLLAFNLDTTFMIEHIHGHHLNAATERDPATARRGEYVLAFVVRSTLGGIANAFAFERARLDRSRGRFWSLSNRALRGQLMSLTHAAGWYWIAGFPGVAAFVFIAVNGKTYLELVNYIEHYGLVRVPGKPIEARHSWDSLRSVSGAILYNLPRHADHHLNGGKPFWRNRPEARAPLMPYGYGTMIVVSLMPRMWKRLTDPLLAEWDKRFASAEELALISRYGD